MVAVMGEGGERKFFETMTKTDSCSGEIIERLGGVSARDRV